MTLSTSALGKSSTWMMTLAHMSRKVFGSRRNISIARASRSASDGALRARQASGSEAGSAMDRLYRISRSVEAATGALHLLYATKAFQRIGRSLCGNNAGDAACCARATVAVRSERTVCVAARSGTPAHRDLSAAAAVPPLH